MVGMWGSYSSQALFVLGSFMLLTFAVPMAIWPLQWARTLRWVIPAQTDLAVYYGRCCGCLAVAISAVGIEAARNPTVQPLVFHLLLGVTVLMVPVHIYGAVKKIQPITETYEIGFWCASVLLTLLFWPKVPV